MGRFNNEDEAAKAYEVHASQHRPPPPPSGYCLRLTHTFEPARLPPGSLNCSIGDQPDIGAIIEKLDLQSIDDVWQVCGQGKADTL